MERQFLGIKKERYHRFILEFRKDAVVSVKYNQKTKSIIFPNLSPLDKDLTGLYDYYAPDGTINSFELINGTFKYKENINNPFKIDVPKIKKLIKDYFQCKRKNSIFVLIFFTDEKT